MSVASWAVARPVAVTMRIFALVLLGAVCVTKLPVDLLPKVNLPTVAVIASWPNTAPEQMETQVTRPLEEAVSQTPNLNQVSSNTSTGSAFVRVQLNWGTDIGQAAVDVLQLVQRARSTLPNDPNFQEPVVFKFDPSALPIMIYSVSGISDPIKLKQIINNEIAPLVESSDGVASAVVTGGLDRSIIVDVDQAKLQAYGFSMANVSQRIGQENIDIPSGIARQNNSEYTIRADGYYTSPQQIAKTPLGTYNGRIITIGDVAKVKDSSQEVRIATRLDGVSAVGLIITKQSDANTISTADAVRAKIAQIEKDYPELKFSVAYDQSIFIQNSIDDLKHSAALGGLLAVLVLLFFLRNVRSTLVVGFSIPISIISTFGLFYFAGYTLNTFSLSGLALASGLIVDDAVVVLENIFRHIERDKLRPAEAAVTATNEIFSAVLASTFTVMIVFLPLFLINGQAGQIFTQFALVVIFAMAISLLDATTVVPMLASRFIRVDEVEEEAHPELRAVHGKKATLLSKMFDWCGSRFHELDNSYRRGLTWALGKRWMILIGALAITLASFILWPKIGTETLPQTDTGDIQMSLKLPVGTAYAVTNADMKKAEQIILANPNVQTLFSAAGTDLNLRGATTSEIGYEGSAFIHLKDTRTASTQAVAAQLQKSLSQIPGARIFLNPFDLVSMILTGNATNFEIDVFGSDYNKLYTLAGKVRDAMRKVSGLSAVDLGVQNKTPEIQWAVDRNKAALLGVDFSDIANALQSDTSGQLSTYYQENGFEYPIYVQAPQDERKTVASLKNLPITPSSAPNGSKAPVLLGQIATPVYSYGPNEITRLNRQRYIAVSGRLSGRSESAVEADVQAVLSKIKMPTGYYTQLGYFQQQRGAEFAGLGLAVFLAIALIYMLLASQFESFIYPLVILTSAPLAISGALVALFISNRAFGITAFIGLLMLIGIVVKNGILLVDYTNQLRARGMARNEAILTAAPTRLRPILMTSSAAILGMLPLALGIGRGSEIQAPLATTVIGGLASSTLLTLFVVPCVYTYFSDLGKKIRKENRDLHSTEMIPPSASSAERMPEAVRKTATDPQI